MKKVIALSLAAAFCLIASLAVAALAPIGEASLKFAKAGTVATTVIGDGGGLYAPARVPAAPGEENNVTVVKLDQSAKETGRSALLFTRTEIKDRWVDLLDSHFFTDAAGKRRLALFYGSVDPFGETTGKVYHFVVSMDGPSPRVLSKKAVVTSLKEVYPAAKTGAVILLKATSASGSKMIKLDAASGAVLRQWSVPAMPFHTAISEGGTLYATFFDAAFTGFIVRKFADMDMSSVVWEASFPSRVAGERQFPLSIASLSSGGAVVTYTEGRTTIDPATQQPLSAKFAPDGQFEITVLAQPLFVYGVGTELVGWIGYYEWYYLFAPSLALVGASERGEILAAPLNWAVYWTDYQAITFDNRTGEYLILTAKAKVPTLVKAISIQ